MQPRRVTMSPFAYVFPSTCTPRSITIGSTITPPSTGSPFARQCLIVRSPSNVSDVIAVASNAAIRRS
jgi:hypothetical protein